MNVLEVYCERARRGVCYSRNMRCVGKGSRYLCCDQFIYSWKKDKGKKIKKAIDDFLKS